jgi:hypothetical protein
MLESGKEYPQPGEKETAEEIVKMLQDQMNRMYAPLPGGEKQLRQVHAKMNGLVKAEFIVEGNIAAEYKIGLFKEPKTYPAWIRFSNGETHVLSDKKKDFRGFAIKVLNVPGKKLDENHPDIPVHDFVMMNRKIFISGNIKKFKDILFVVTTPHTLSSIPKKAMIFLSNTPVLYRAFKGKIANRNPGARAYFSTTPYRFGDETKAVKYAVFPSAANPDLSPDKKSDDLLRVNLATTLKEHQLEYEFKIQFQEDPDKMPIENPTVQWNSPFHKVATIRIPIQDFNTDERNEIGENISFNPWHCLAEHQPLGNFNRARKIIYDRMYEYRHKHNDVTDVHPVAGPDFFNDTKFI